MTRAKVTDKTLDAVAWWAAYYRENPHRFAKDILNLDLRRFQKILLVMMFRSKLFLMIAARGIGKSFIAAIYICIRAILYPGTKIVIASKTRGQSLNILEKVMMELVPNSPALKMEIDEKLTKTNGTQAILVFRNGSYAKVVTAGDSARGNRAHILIIDEYRLVDKDAIDTILARFLTNTRMPKYEELTDAERKEALAKEENMTLYLSSAWYQSHWSYEKMLSVFQGMLDDPSNEDFACGLPYQVSMLEGLLRPADVKKQMQEPDFSEVKWIMEMGAEFYGSADGAFFDYSQIEKTRHLTYPYCPASLTKYIPSAAQIRIPPKKNGEKRILSADIALMASGKYKNDATAIFINFVMPTKAGRYVSNIVYCDTMEGAHTEYQALVIRRLFDEYQCDYIVLDCNGVGMSVYDRLATDIPDNETGEIYPALSCCNNQEMAARAPVGAPKVIWAIKASAAFNSDAAFLLREAFNSGRVRLLTEDYKAALGELRGYGSIDDVNKTKLQMPYIHTELLIDELIQLQFEEVNGKVKLFERSGMRKDRYSSLSYNYYVATQLETKMRRRSETGSSSKQQFIIRPPRSVITKGGRFL